MAFFAQIYITIKQNVHGIFKSLAPLLILSIFTVLGAFIFLTLESSTELENIHNKYNEREKYIEVNFDIYIYIYFYYNIYF